jgi:hypothetical protein
MFRGVCNLITDRMASEHPPLASQCTAQVQVVQLRYLVK